MYIHMYVHTHTSIPCPDICSVSHYLLAPNTRKTVNAIINPRPIQHKHNYTSLYIIIFPIITHNTSITQHFLEHFYNIKAGKYFKNLSIEKQQKEFFRKEIPTRQFFDRLQKITRKNYKKNYKTTAKLHETIFF